MTDELVLHFTFMGLLGGVAYVLVHAKRWRDLTRFQAARRYVLGAITGFLYWNLHSAWAWPDIIMGFVTGYMGTSFIEALIDKFRPKPTQPSRPRI